MNEIEKLQEENRTLKEALTDKSDLISITAHQLRTSLTALKWILQMLVDKDVGEVNKEQEDYLRKALTSNDRMIALVTRALSFNHADEPIAPQEKQEINLETMLDEISFEFSGETRKKNIALSIEKHPPIPVIQGDAGVTRAVLESIIENAIKYSTAGNALLISIGTDDTKKMVSISVHDNGIGIGESDKAHIFDKFYRSAEAQKTGVQGSGLGLFIARTMLAQHGGSISFESSSEKGTTFFITIPVA